MTKSPQLFLALLVPALLLGLTGCFLLPDEKPEHVTLPDDVMPTVEPVPVETMMPTRITRSCGTLISAEELAGPLEVPAKSIDVVEQSLDYVSATTAQGGGLTCVWTGTAGKASSHLTVRMLQGAGEYYSLYVARHPEVLQTTAPDQVVNTIAMNALFYCVVESKRTCSGIFEKGGYWVELTFGGPVVEAGSVSAEDALAVGTRILKTLGGGGASYPDFYPAQYLDAWSSCAELDPDGSYVTGLGSPSLRLDESVDDTDLDAAAAKIAGAGTCRWTNDSQSSASTDELSRLDASILPGGDWAWSELRLNAMRQPESVEEAIVGAYQAVSSCESTDEGFECRVIATVAGSILTVTASGAGDSAAVRLAGVAALGSLIERL